MSGNIAMARTTLELPEQMLREIKAKAALEGIKLKDFFIRALGQSLSALQPSPKPEPTVTREPFPVLIRRQEGSGPILSFTGADLQELFDREDYPEYFVGVPDTTVWARHAAKQSETS